MSCPIVRLEQGNVATFEYVPRTVFGFPFPSEPITVFSCSSQQTWTYPCVGFFSSLAVVFCVPVSLWTDLERPRAAFLHIG